MTIKDPMDQLTARILDRDYRLSCEPAERERLLAAVARVDAEMRAIRDHGKIAGAERIAVLAALNIASESLSNVSSSTSVALTSSSTSESTIADEEIVRRMRLIDALLDTALVDQERLF